MKASGLAPGPGAIGVDKMERHAKLATAVALFVAVASALVVIPTMDTADADTGGLEVPEISDEYLIGSDFDWTSIEEGQNYKIISEIVITTNDNKVLQTAWIWDYDDSKPSDDKDDPGDLRVDYDQKQVRVYNPDDATQLGRPEGFTITVSKVKVSAGAGFVVVQTGDIMTMPGLPKVPAAEKIDVDENGVISGLF